MAAEYETPICTTTPFPYCPEKPSFKLGVADVMGQVPTKPCPQRPQSLNKCPPSKKPDALFVKAFVFGVELDCLVDTGCTGTILHSGNYFRYNNTCVLSLPPLLVHYERPTMD